MTTAGFGAVHAASRTSPRGSRGALTSSSSGTACVLPAKILAAAAPNALVSAAPVVHSRHPAASGNLVVGIPAAVFIRRAGQRLIITTNTGRAPGPTDMYYLIDGGHSTLVDASDRSRVESGCAYGAVGGATVAEPDAMPLLAAPKAGHS
jgi:hypothetical protein